MYQPTLLIVDDDANILSAFADFCRRESYTMLAATSVEEGLKQFAAHRVDLLITDIRLQRESGITLVLRCQSLRKNLPVIAITGHPESINELDLRNLGISFVLMKPLDLDRLRAAVFAALHRAGHQTESK